MPGTYRNTGSSGCYWERVSMFGGGGIIANDNTDTPTVVTIAPGDKGFVSKGCGAWSNNLSQITSSKTQFNDGTFIVGVDVAPGTYRNTGSSGCYWERVSMFGGGGIIANDNTDMPTVVTIAAGDKGFVSKGCGTWNAI